MSEYLDKKSGLDLYLVEISSKFNRETLQENESLEKEVEFKVFVEGIKKSSDFYDLQKEIIDKLGGNIIFDGTIRDERFFDTKDRDKSILYKNGINLIRVRRQRDFKDLDNIEEKYIYTVKKYDENGDSDELESEVEKNFGDKNLIGEYGLERIKITKKKRKEIEFFVDIDGKREKVKIAFDKYFDENNKNIEAFFEVEAKSEKIAKEAFDKIKELDFFTEEYKNKKISFVKQGPTKIHIQENKNKVYNIIKEFKEEIFGEIDFDSDKNSETEIIKKEILDLVLKVFESENIYKDYEEFFEKIEKNNLNSEIDDKEELFFSFVDLLKKIVNRKSKKDIFENYFHRIITNDDPNKEDDKKFDDKISREYKSYLKVFIQSIKQDFLNSEKLDKNEIKKILKEKINSLLKILFVFDDSLTGEEFLELLSMDKSKLDDNIKKFDENLLKLEKKYKKHPYEIWGDFEFKYQNRTINIDNSRVLKMLYTGYSRATAFTAIGKDRNPFDKNKIEKNLKKFELEQFELLERRFSHWLNSPQRDPKEFSLIRKLLLENFYHIFLLSKSQIAFTKLNVDSCFFNQDFINNVLKKYSKFIVNKNNFLIKDKGPELFRNLIADIFGSEKKVRKEIIDEFKKFNLEHNNAIIKDRDFESLEVELLNDNSFKKINFKNWQKLPIEARIRIFLGKVIKKPLKDGIKLNSEILSDEEKSSEIFNKFLEYEFNKKNNKRDKNYNKNLENFKKETKNQFNSLKNYFKSHKIGNKSDEYKILYLARNNINSFNLLVSWFQFNLKDKYIKENEDKDLKIEDLSLHSESFSEKVLRGLDRNVLNDNNFEFITSTSSAYNTSISDIKLILDLHDRIGNGKPINLLKNFGVKIGNTDILLKDLKNLYYPGGDVLYNYLKKGLKTVRDLINGDKTNSKYYKNLLAINFPINDKIALKKLLEFQKLVYKIINPFTQKLVEKGDNTTNKISSLINNFIQEENKNNKIKDYYNIAETKGYLRTLEKIISKYGGNIEQVGDLARGTIFGDDFYDLTDKTIEVIEFLKDTGKVKSTRFEDKIGNPFKKAKRSNGYRDSTLAITFDTGETVELQFQMKDYYNIKTGELKFENGYLSIYQKNKKSSNLSGFDIKSKLEGEKIYFTEEEKDKIINYSKITGFKIVKHFALLFGFDLEILKKEGILKEDGFNADFTYNLERTIGIQNKSINNKLEILDRILFDIPAGIMAEKELKRIMGWKNIKD